MARDLTSVEVLGLAVRSEQESAAFYRGIAKKVENPMVKFRFQSLAKEEDRHEELLVNLFKKLTGGDEPPEIPGSPETAESKVNQDVATGDMEELLDSAIERERQAEAFYRELAEGTRDPSGKKVLNYLAGMEKTHAYILGTELETYRNDKNFYYDFPDLQFMGP